MIARERPDDAILGEELARPRAATGYRWVLDPVDGTRAFITGRHEWGSLIALEKDGAPVLGILDQPVLGERFIGVNGAAHLVQAGQQHAAQDPRMRRAERRHSLRHRSRRPIFRRRTATPSRASKAEARMTRYGGDCYLFAALALGFVDLMIEAGFHAWDVAALIPLVEGAGGIITNWDGGSRRAAKPFWRRRQARACRSDETSRQLASVRTCCSMRAADSGKTRCTLFWPR